MIQDTLTELNTAITKAQEALRRDLAKLRTGRAHPAMLDGIRVEYYGQTSPLSQMATVGVPEPRLLTVKPWDRSQLKAIEKALRESDLGLNPQPEADLIRIPIPPLSEERRRDLGKIAKRNGEECKVVIRKARHDAIDLVSELKKDGEISEDDAERGKKQVEEVIAKAVKLVDDIIQAKEKEILVV